MSSREQILAAVGKNQPENCILPDINTFKKDESGLPDKFISVLESIGGKAYVIDSIMKVPDIVKQYFSDVKRIVSLHPQLSEIEGIDISIDPHLLEDIDLAILASPLAVAENAAVWVTEDLVKERVLPFICQYLAVVIHKQDIVATMHQAYDKIGADDYSFGTFIAGPSKTADIEQSLVLGAHGPKGMTVFVVDGEGKSVL